MPETTQCVFMDLDADGLNREVQGEREVVYYADQLSLLLKLFGGVFWLQKPIFVLLEKYREILLASCNAILPRYKILIAEPFTNFYKRLPVFCTKSIQIFNTATLTRYEVHPQGVDQPWHKYP